jgi:hypothetical protein
LVASIEGELLRHKERWGQNENSLYYNIATIKNFLNQRPAVARNFIRNKFQFPASNTVNTHINNPAYGSIQLNSLYIKEANWSGVYFQNNLITLTAVAQPGHVFERWSGDIQSTNVSIELNPTKTFNITAHFKTTTIEEPAVVINEINYNSLPEEDVSDWVELHNFSSQPKDISGWILKDDNDNHSFIFPSNTILQSWGFLVVCRDLPGFQSIYQFVDNAIGGMDFGLSSDGDAVRLFTEVGDLHDEVYFLPFSPWPEDANGKGPTLELISPELDNALASNWKAYPGLGTPGQVNHLPTHTDEQLGEEVIKIFPNPTTHSLKVMVESSFLTISSVRLVDNLGIAYQMQSFSENLSSVHLDLSGIPVGNYILILTLNDGISKAIKVSKI